MIEIMLQVCRYLILFSLATGLSWAGGIPAQGQLAFPRPERPVAKIVSPAYSDEKTRDSKGEAERVIDRIGVTPGTRVADIGAGAGYYTVRLARRLSSSAAIYAQDVKPEYLTQLEARLEKEGIRGVRFVLGMVNDPKLPPNAVDIALVSHVYHEIENPYEFFYRLRPALAPDGRVAIIDVDRPTRDHGTSPALLRCELEALGYRQIDFISLAPADGYLAIFSLPAELPPVSSILLCVSEAVWDKQRKESK